MTDTKKRIHILDITRGIAILGILTVNIFYYAYPEILSWALPVTDPDGGPGYWVGMAAEILFSGKMRGLFAMLFGISSIIILDRLTQRYDAGQAAQIYFRRMVWLLGFGLIHGFLLLYPGDILFQYAAVGIFAFPFYKASPRVRIFAMLICLAVLTYKPYRDYVYTIDLDEAHREVTAQEVPLEELSEEDLAIVEEWEEETKYITPIEEDYADEVEAKHGGYLSVFEFNKDRVVSMESYDLYNWYFWDIFLYMLLGISLFHAGFFSDAFSTKRLLLLGIFTLGLGGFLHTWLHLGFYNNFTDPVTSLYYLIFFDLGRVPMVLGYASFIILIFRMKLFHRLGVWMSATGRMTLTNYLMQSVFGAIIFYGCGLFNQVDRVQVCIIMVIIWIFQILFSNLWMMFFIYGPVEWVWRSLTYWRVQKFWRKPRPEHELPGAGT